MEDKSDQLLAAGTTIKTTFVYTYLEMFGFFSFHFHSLSKLSAH